MQNKQSLKKKLGIGLLGAVMGLVGDFLLGWLVYPSFEIPYAGMIAGCADLSYARMGLSICFGGIGIPLQYFGFKAIADMIREGGHTRLAGLVHSGGAATAAMGGAVHILCVVAMMLVRAECDNGFDPAAAGTLLGTVPDSAMQFLLWALLPFTAIFYVLYYDRSYRHVCGVCPPFHCFAAHCLYFQPADRHCADQYRYKAAAEYPFGQQYCHGKYGIWFPAGFWRYSGDGVSVSK